MLRQGGSRPARRHPALDELEAALTSAVNAALREQPQDIVRRVGELLVQAADAKGPAVAEARPEMPLALRELEERTRQALDEAQIETISSDSAKEEEKLPAELAKFTPLSHEDEFKASSPSASSGCVCSGAQPQR